MFHLNNNTLGFQIKGRFFDESNLVSHLSSSSYSIRSLLQRLDGEYSFIFSDKNRTVVARDCFGTRPLYVVTDKHDGRLLGFSFSTDGDYTFRLFPNGSFWTSDSPDCIFSFELRLCTVRYDFNGNHVDTTVQLLLNAVKKRVHDCNPIVIPNGCALSEMLTLLSNIIASKNNKNKDIYLSTQGGRSLFGHEESLDFWGDDERYTFPFLDVELFSYVKQHRSKDLMSNVLSQLYTL